MRLDHLLLESLKKDLHKVLKELQKQGWDVTLKKGSGHWKCVPPRDADGSKGGKIVYTSSTPSDHRSLKNFISLCRKQGFVWRGR